VLCALPIEYVIDTEQRLIATTVTGVVAASEMLAHYRTLQADPAFDPAFDAIVDFSGAAPFGASGEEVRELARNVPGATGTRRALVVDRDLHYGFGRMASSARASELEIQVFRSRAEALAWLGRAG
jgi:hypothetical protein